MQLKFFQIQAGDYLAEEELNKFLRSHRVLRIERELTRRDSSPAWAVCVEYLEGVGPAIGSPRRSEERKVDYKEMLNAADFGVFSALREVRKSLSEAEGVPVYAVFTNDQLAKLAQTRPASKAALEKVEGVGVAKVEKYGERMLAVIAAAAVIPA
jgi:superfamily II DNA helicase RecQ